MANVTVSITLDSTILTKLIDATCALYHYEPMIVVNAETGEMAPNPETKAQFTKRIVLVDHARAIIRQYAAQQASEAARLAAIAAEDAANIIT